MNFEYWHSTSDNHWYWHLKAANGETIAHGEGHIRKEDCLHAIELVQASVKAPVYPG